MGSKLALLAAVPLIALGARTAHADTKALARSLFELAIEEYKAKQYEAAIASLSKSYALDPKADALYALAQAERLAGDCKAALAHYEQLLGQTKDDKIAKAVQANIELCTQIESGKEPPPASVVETQATAQRDAPVVEYRTVVRTERTTDTVMVGSFIGGGVFVSGSVALYLVARSSRSSADRAQSLDEYNDLYDRSRTLRYASYATAGVGAALIAVGVVRLVRGGDATPTEREVALVPVDGGSMLSFGGRW